MKGFRYGIVPALLAAMVVLVLHAAGAGRGESAMKSVAFAAERPAIDLAVPAELETATFALG
ncbi:MAG: hypothetical protein ACYC7L_16605 [Nitrospirota bacterium]